jgi:hypothetical protein
MYRLDKDWLKFEEKLERSLGHVLLLLLVIVHLLSAEYFAVFVTVKYKR